MVPEGWREAILAHVAGITMGQSPLSSDVAPRPPGLPFVQGNAQFGVVSPTPEGWIPDPPRVAAAGSILMSVRAPVGAINVIDEPFAIGRGLCAIRPADGRSTRGFLLATLGMSGAYLESRAQGSTFTAVNKADIHELPILLPPLPEQRKIAAILSSVDDAIAATRKVIEQTEQVKTGLLQTLMTRGIGHTRFKKTEIGEIPEEWEVVELERVSQRGSGHTPSKQYPHYWNGGVKWVSLADSGRLDRVYIAETAKTITPAGIANSSAVLHPAGSVMVSRDAGVGKSAIATCDLAVSQHFIVWTCGPRLDNHFLYYLLQHRKPEFERMATGSTIKTIGLGYLRALRIPLPPLEEQESIARSLLAHDQSCWRHEEELAQLHTLKRGLLQDLLTGRVRVTPA
jgi:type I restriction enzyme, S subunit